MQVRIIERKPVTIVYLPYVGLYGEPLARFWGETVYPWIVSHDLLNRARYGISHDDPNITEPELCRYDAGVEVPDDYVAIGNAHKKVVPGGRYAVLNFEGTAGEMGAVWRAILADWLPASGLQLDARPCFEHYPPDAFYDPDTGVFSCEICLPVAPL